MIVAIGIIGVVLVLAGNSYISDLEATRTADPMWFHLWRGLWWFAGIGVVLLVRQRNRRT